MNFIQIIYNMKNRSSAHRDMIEIALNRCKQCEKLNFEKRIIRNIIMKILIRIIVRMSRFLSFSQLWIALISLYYNDQINRNHIWFFWLTCTMWSNRKLLKHFEMILTHISIENSNSQLMKIIDFKKNEHKIEQNVFRSIIRVKRIYWSFFHKLF